VVIVLGNQHPHAGEELRHQPQPGAADQEQRRQPVVARVVIDVPGQLDQDASWSRPPTQRAHAWAISIADCSDCT
jgi:hypothetical protein